MSGFGDLDPADVVDTAAPDAEAVARRLFLEVRRIAPDRPLFDDLPELERVLWAFAVAAVLAALARERA